ncbi:hypothetical protein ABH926_003496 [Catenulispora sp. GP43]|uniref:hypothetical protein n=1 Tax=Catenulispora sp. GP43 TaxID=3156263 RepID=UPI003511D5B9
MPHRRLFIAAASLVLVAGGAIAVTAAAGSSSKPATPSRYQDYLGGGSGSTGQSDDQCDKPVAQRTGGWVCPPTSDK